MESVSFKTNMKCAGCIEKVTPELNDLAGKDHWKVDLQNPNKTLTISSENIRVKEIMFAVEKAGFTLEKI